MNVPCKTLAAASQVDLRRERLGEEADDGNHDRIAELPICLRVRDGDFEGVRVAHRRAHSRGVRRRGWGPSVRTRISEPSLW